MNLIDRPMAAVRQAKVVVADIIQSALGVNWLMDSKLP